MKELHRKKRNPNPWKVLLHLLRNKVVIAFQLPFSPVTLLWRKFFEKPREGMSCPGRPCWSFLFLSKNLESKEKTNFLAEQKTSGLVSPAFKWMEWLLLCTMVREIRMVEVVATFPWVAKNLCPGKVFLCITCLSLPMGERRGHFDAVSSCSTPQWTWKRLLLLLTITIQNFCIVNCITLGPRYSWPHGASKSHKKSHSKLRAKRATITFEWTPVFV